MYFNELNLIPQLLRALEQEGYQKPTPIQEQAIPSFLQGRDLFGTAQTGTGKTAAFCIPLLQQLHLNTENSNRNIRAVVLAPTRELAIQISESLHTYGRHLALKHIVVYGGVAQGIQTQALRNGVDIVVATPGRFLDLMGQGYIKLGKVEFLVLDEADMMLDMGFINDIRKIIKAIPQERQTILFSATLPNEIRSLASQILRNPIHIELSKAGNSTASVVQSMYFVDGPNKRNLLSHILKEDSVDRALVFMKTKHSADKLTKALNKENIMAEAIHGNKSQGQRQKTLKKFKSKKLRVLVATDVAARGIDIDDLSHVINFDLPQSPEIYIHRIGRTGRAGATGIALSFCGKEELGTLKDIHRHLGKNIPEVTEHPFMIPISATSGSDKGQKPKRRSGFNRNSKFKKRFRHRKSA